MAEFEHDDLADALSRMSDGEADEAPIDFEALTPVPVKPAAVRPATVRPATKPAVKAAAPAAPARVARPAAPVIKPVAPAPQPVVAPPVVMPRPQRPAAPTARPAAPIIAQQMVEEESVYEDPSQGTTTDAETGIFDDGDSVIVPAPEASVFVSRTKTVAAARAKVKQHKNLVFQRTLIPILLTVGAILIVFGALKYTIGTDSILSQLPPWVSHILFFAGAVSLVLASVVMISVKKTMDAGVT